MNNVCKAFLRKATVISASILGLATRWPGPGPALGLDHGGGREITVTVCASIRAESGYEFTFSGPFDETTPAMGTVKKKGHFCDGLYAQAWGVTHYRVVQVEDNHPYFEEIDSQASGLLAGGGNQSDSYTYISDLPPHRMSYQAWWTYEAAPSGDKPHGPSIDFRGDDKHTDLFVGLPDNFPPAEKRSGLGIYCQTTPYKDPGGNGPRMISRAIGLAMDDMEFKKDLMVKADWSKPVFANHSARYVWNDKVEGPIG